MKKYWNEVTAIAEHVRNRFPEPSLQDERKAHIQEMVEWSDSLSIPSTVLRESYNVPDPEDVQDMMAPDDDPDVLAASLAMQVDVWERLEEVDEEAAEAERKKRPYYRKRWGKEAW